MNFGWTKRRFMLRDFPMFSLTNEVSTKLIM